MQNNSDSKVESVFGRSMREARLRRGYSQKDLAEALAASDLDLDASAISRMEKGTRALRLSEAIAVCDVLSTTLDQMLVLDRGAALARETIGLSKDFNAAIDAMDECVRSAVDLQMRAKDLIAKLEAAEAANVLEGEDRGRLIFLRMRMNEVVETAIGYHAANTEMASRDYYEGKSGDTKNAE